MDLHRIAADDAALAPATSDQRRVRSHTAAHRQDTGRSTHALDVFRRGLLTDEDGRFAGSRGGHRRLGREDDRTDGTARGSGQALRQHLGFLFGRGVEDRVEDLVELGGGDPHHGGLLVDHALGDHVGGHLQGGQAGALADTALEHPQLAFLDGELDVLHVVEVVLELQADRVELGVDVGHCLRERLEVLVLLALGGLVQGVRGADTRNHVFTLGVDEPLAVELVVTVGRVARERHARRGSVAHVAEDHRLHVDGRSPVIRNLLDPAVGDGALAVPGLEHAADRTPQLGFGGVRELDAEDFLHLRLELLAEDLELVCGDFGVGGVALGFLELGHHAVELLADALAIGRFDALGLLHDDIGVHHDQAPVGVIDETRVAGLLDHARQRRGAQTDVEDGVHHARHGTAGAAAAADEERILRVAELLAHDGLGGLQGFRYFALQVFGISAAEGIILGAAFRRDGESGRNRHSQFAHFREVGAFAAEELAHLAVTFGLLSAETIDSFLVLEHC